jgi:hypothetical protein
MPQPTSDDQQKALYDEACKTVLSEKGIAAHILKECVEEYKDIPVSDIIHKYIQGKPVISKILVQDEGTLTKIRTEQTEDSSEKEGTVFFDVRFTVLVPDEEDSFIELIINFEAQNDFHPGYPLLKRGIYYCSRMISSQYGTVFTKSDYGKIIKVYSIWICTNPTLEQEYSITRYKMTEENLVGKVKAPKQHYDLLDVVMICLGRKKYNELTGLLSLLNLTLLDNNLDSNEKRRILSTEFNVEITPELEKGVDDMCNLSAGIEKNAREEERKKAILETEARAKDMIRDRMDLSLVEKYTRLPLPRIKELAHGLDML